MQTKRGQSIEDASMDMIEKEIKSHNYDEWQWPIVRRIIHSTADFDFAGDNRVIFHDNAIQSGIKSLKNGGNIITDVNGIPGLLNKRNLADYNNKTICKISDDKVAKLAKQMGTTRAKMSMLQCVDEMQDGVVVIGNAPTALLEVISMVRQDTAQPALIVGVPVGFIQAAESKAELETVSVPYITNRGRKGGSPVAAAIINALFKLLRSPP